MNVDIEVADSNKDKSCVSVLPRIGNSSDKVKRWVEGGHLNDGVSQTVGFRPCR